MKGWAAFSTLFYVADYLDKTTHLLYLSVWYVSLKSEIPVTVHLIHNA